MRISIGYSGIAMFAFACRLGGKNLSSKRCFPLEQFAETDIATPGHPMLVRIFENNEISTFSILTP